MKIALQFWKADWHLSLLLGFLFLIVFVLYPISNRGMFVTILLQSFLSLILISGVAVVATRRAARVVATLLAAGTAAVGWFRLYTDNGVLTVLGVSLWILFLVMLIWVILIRVSSDGRINIHRIQGAVAAYLLIGVIWSGFYRLMVYFDGGAFSLSDALGESTLMSKLVYFSFVTLTTVGYGDIAAVHPVARSLAMVEALTGQLFLTVLVARLISMEVTHPSGQ